MEQLPIEILPATNESVLAAAHIKATYPVAYADGFSVVACSHKAAKTPHLRHPW
jgi:hypothetical protein